MKFTIAAGGRLLLVAVLCGASGLAMRAARGQGDDQSDDERTESIRLRESREPAEDEVNETAAQTESREEELSSGPAARDDGPARHGQLQSGKKPAIDGASLKGIKPGRSTREDVENAWGPPKETRNLKGGVQQYYKLEQFRRVMVTLSDDVVTSIVVYLEKPITAHDVARQLDLSKFEAVVVTDPKGQVLGQAYPERGVLFGFADGAGEKPVVSQIVLEPIDAQPFMLRAEAHLQDHTAQTLADIDYALHLSPRNARAHWIRAQTLLFRGDLAHSLKAAEAAVSLEPAEPEFQLTLAKIQSHVSDHLSAKALVEAVLANQKVPAVVQARAFGQLGDCFAAIESRDYQQALKHHLQAIKLAEPLATNEQVAIRRAAKEIMLDAHLAVARDIAWGKWQQKQKVVPKWLERATALANDLVEHEKGSEELRFRVHEQALAALAGVRDAPDTDRWIAATLRIGKQLAAGADDDTVKGTIEWRLGLALTDALSIEQGRGRHDKCLEYGQLATAHFKRGAKAAEAWPNRDFVIGRLYYRIGAIYAVRKQDHKQAVAWYDQAVSLLERPVPSSALADTGRQGETFVSMAVSYWEMGGREEAMRLTRQGAKLMEKAVEEGVMEKSSLAVPYGNLSNMHQELGDAKHAAEFAEMAAHLEQSGPKK